MNIDEERLRQNIYLLQYYVLGAMITGGIAGTVAGSRMIQSMFVSVPGTSNSSVPPGISLMIISSVCFGVSAGYLLRDIQLEKWSKNP
jgi:hypothetical protein